MSLVIVREPLMPDLTPVIRTVLTPYVSTQRHHGSSLHIYFHETFNDQLPIDAFDFVISSS